MPNIERLQAEIAEFEGFAVKIRPAKDGASPTKSNLKSYANNFQRIARKSFSVEDWKRRRFRDTYPGYEVDVLLKNGTIAPTKAKISKIRNTYA
jgi:hypothetical protein